MHTPVAGRCGKFIKNTQSRLIFSVFFHLNFTLISIIDNDGTNIYVFAAGNLTEWRAA